MFTAEKVENTKAVGPRWDTETSQEPEYGPSDPPDQILPGQTVCSQRPCEARQGLGPQGKASSTSRWPFLILSQESQLQALGPAIQESLLEGRPLLLSGVHSPFLFAWDSQNLNRCSQSAFTELLLPSPSRHTFVNVASFVSAVLFLPACANHHNP